MQVAKQVLDVLELRQIAGSRLFHGRDGGGVGNKRSERQRLFACNPSEKETNRIDDCQAHRGQDRGGLVSNLPVDVRLDELAIRHDGRPVEVKLPAIVVQERPPFKAVLRLF